MLYMSPFNLPKTRWGECDPYPYFLEEETEAQGDGTTC